MPPVSDSAVQIVINVTDGNSGEVIAKVERAFQNMGAAGATTGKKAAQGMKDLAAGAKVAADASGKAGEEMGGHFQTAFDRVRLLRTELGVQVPRAMESIIARNQTLMAGINALGSALVAVGAVGIFVSLGKELFNVYNKYFSLTAAAKQYALQVQKAKLEDFGNTHSIETTTERINDATEAVKNYQAAAERTNKTGWTGLIGSLANPWGGSAAIANLAISHQMAGAAITNQQQIDKLTPKKAEQNHEAAVAQIELNHALDGELRGRQKINAEMEKRQQMAAEARRYENEQDQARGNPVAKDAGASKERLADQTAEKEAAAETFNLNREQAHELTQMRNEATNAMLHGAALYKAQEEQAIEELKYKDMDSMAARSAVHEKFHAEEMKRLQEEQQAVARRAREANSSGLTGIAKIQAEGQSRDQDILADVAAGKYQSLADAQEDRVTNQRKTLAEMASAERSFTQNVNMLADQSATHQISGFARIRADESKQLDDLKKKFDDIYGHMDMSAPGAAGIYAQGQSDLQRGQAAIRAGADQQSADLARKNAEETEQIEAEARSKYLSAEKQKTAAIETEYEQRLQKYQEQLNAQEISFDDYNRRIQAAAAQRDAEMMQAATEARQKMASEFDSFFKGMNHPLQELQNLGDKVAANAAAAMVQKLQMKRSGTALPNTRSGGLLEQVFGIKMPGGHGAPGAVGAHDVGGTKMIALGSATISVQSAQIAFGGAAVGGVSTAPGRALSSGWTGSNGAGAGFSGGAGGGSTASFAGGAGGSSSGSGVSGAIGDVSKGVDLFGQAKSTFSSSSSSGVQPFSAINGPNDPLGLNGPGTGSSSTTASTSNGGMLNGGGFMSNVGGAATGALGLYSAYNSSGGVGGALGGAMSGMQLGMAVGGPVGAAVGAAAGAVMGAFGPGGAEKARVYYLKQVLPRITADQDSYNQGGMDYLAAYSDLQSLDMQAKKATNAMGFAGQHYYQDNIKPAIQKAEQNFTREQRAGRSNVTTSAAQYDVGSDSVPRDGFAFIHKNERIMPSDQNERITRAIESGGNMMPVDTAAGGDVHLHLNAIDAKSSMQFLMANKHTIRSAVNASYAENSGGSDA